MMATNIEWILGQVTFWLCFICKIIHVLLGDVGAGKSSLVLRFVKEQYVEFQESTIGAAFFSQTLAVNDAMVKFEIWDTTDQERYHSLAPMYYKGASAAIIVYDITNQARVGQGIYFPLGYGIFELLIVKNLRCKTYRKELCNP
ncbi:hypothetical protein Pint_11711 [Pistacia integerrima]|uniref:Uncharacterized protein n=1 Tax=Pistacia integerrima TaxID=434235 RepID=A0ACC0XHL9_9ROSI|nr:hypothetical protein Pint_11711 [Pistacia integerrima]